MILSGRLTKAPVVSVASKTQNTVARFNLAIDRGKDKNGESKGADFPSIVCFGKTAEIADKWLDKGSQVIVIGSLQTGSYEKDGKKVYTTDVIANRIEFMSTKEQAQADGFNEKPAHDDSPVDGFALAEDDIPFD